MSRPLWEQLRRRDIDLIVPPRRSQHVQDVDGRQLRRYRWIIERTNVWHLSFRRLTVRHDHQLEHDRAFVDLACALIALRQL